MNFLPVIEREMRVAARQPLTLWLRFAAVATALGMILLVLVGERGPSRRMAETLLTMLAACGMFFALFSGVIFTVDAFARERREGTLGLLFLTPLQPRDILLGKLTSHSLSAVTLLVALLPTLAVPLLLGGVTGGEVVRVCLVLLLILFWSLSLGLGVGLHSTENRRNLMVALGWILGLAGGPLLVGFLVDLKSGQGREAEWFYRLSPFFALAYGMGPSYAVRGGGLFWASVMVTTGQALAALLWASWRLRRVPQTDSPEPQSSSLSRPGPHARVQLESVPAGQAYLWRAGRHGRSVGERLEGYGFALLTAFWAFMLCIGLFTRHWEEGFTTALFTAMALHALVKIGLALETTRCLHDDHRSGALELLLATPLDPHNITGGVADRAWSRFRRRFRWLIGINCVMQASVLLFFKHLHMERGVWLVFTVFFMGGLLALPFDRRALVWGGMKEAFRARTHLGATFRVVARVLIPGWALLPILFVLGISARSIRREEFLAAGLVTLGFVALGLYSTRVANRSRDRLARDFRKIASGDA